MRNTGLRTNALFLVVLALVGSDAVAEDKAKVPDVENPAAALERRRTLRPEEYVEIKLADLRRKPTLPVITGSYLFFSDRQDVTAGCTGQGLFAQLLVPERGKKKIEEKSLLTEKVCVNGAWPFVSNGPGILVHTRTEDGDEALRWFDARKLEEKPFVGADLLEPKKKGLLNARVAYAIDRTTDRIKMALSRDSERRLRLALVDTTVYAVWSVRTTSRDVVFLDAVRVGVPSSPRTPVPQLVTAISVAKPLLAASGADATSLYVASDGAERTMGRVHRLDGSATSFGKELAAFGGPKSIRDTAWVKLTPDLVAFRHPEFLAAFAHGAVVMETSTDFSWDSRYVFYFDLKNKEALRLTYLNSLVGSITGLSPHDSGLLVGSEGLVRWFGDKSPFGDDYPAKPVSESFPSEQENK